MDLLRIIKDLKEIKIFIKNKFFDKVTKFQIQHNKKNIIDLEDTSNEEDDNH